MERMSGWVKWNRSRTLYFVRYVWKLIGVHQKWNEYGFRPHSCTLVSLSWAMHQKRLSLDVAWVVCWSFPYYKLFLAGNRQYPYVTASQSFYPNPHGAFELSMQHDLHVYYWMGVLANNPSVQIQSILTLLVIWDSSRLYSRTDLTVR
jgi:hypothetical protein